MHREEGLARELLDMLGRHCPAGTTVTIAGAGALWHCVAERGERYCSIACYQNDGTDAGPEYLCYFRIGAGIDAMGRTGSLQDAVQAVTCWMQGEDVPALHERFSFVDAEMRALASIRDRMVARFPEIAALPPQLHDDYLQRFTLECAAGDRACRLSYTGGRPVPPLPEAEFAWSDTMVFRATTDDAGYLAKLVKRWVCDGAMPSAMRAEFAGIEIGKVADAFEAGRPIEAEFIASWDDVEGFYGELRQIDARAILGFIAQLRGAGFDRTLRAGQSHLSLIVSRARHDGLRPDQPLLAFRFHGSDAAISRMTVHDERGAKLPFGPIALTPEVESMLRELVERPID